MNTSRTAAWIGALRAPMAMVLAAAALLQGCTSTLSRDISYDGIAREVVFPDLERDAWVKEGTFPNLDNLRQVGPGVTRYQLSNLLGRPHFAADSAGAREWDYIFNFRSGGGVTVCQYKAIFDGAAVARSFHWLPAACAGMLAAKAAPPAPAGP